MPIEVKVPELSDSVKEAVLVEWLVEAGSRVDIDQILVDIETEKVVLEVPSPAAGWIAKIFVPSGAAVASGQTIAEISDEKPPVAAGHASQQMLATKAQEIAAPPKRIFLSYRRDESIDISDRMFDQLVSQFGERAVFKDIDSLPLGRDFRMHLRRELESCGVVIAVIGKTWATICDDAGAPRLTSESDFVRLELEIALSRSIPVIPVLVGGATMPSPSQLPASIEALVYRHGVSVRSGPHFRSDMDALIRGLIHHFSSEA